MKNRYLLNLLIKIPVKVRFIALFFSILIFLLPINSYAVVGEIVYDPALDADVIQTFSYFETEITDLEKQLANLEKELKVLTKYLWSDTSNLISQLNSTMNQASALSYAAKNEAAQFSQLFPGYTALDNFNAQYQKITKTALDTLNNMIQSLGVNAANFASENSRVKQLQSFAENVEGQTQAIQTAVQLAAEQISQLQLLRQAIMAEANAQAVYFAQQIQKEASAVAEFNDIAAHGDMETTGTLNAHPLEKPQYEQ